MNKVELQGRVDALTDEINFLRTLYDLVRMCSCRERERGDVLLDLYVIGGQQD